MAFVSRGMVAVLKLGDGLLYRLKNFSKATADCLLLTADWRPKAATVLNYGSGSKRISDQAAQSPELLLAVPTSATKISLIS